MNAQSGPTTFDVIIIGGGMTGACMALALADTALRIAVIEGHPPAEQWPESDDSKGFDMRVSAITRASQQIFTSLGAWQGMLDERVSPLRAMQVWDASGDGRIHFDSADIGEPLLGHIIENRVIQKALLQTLQTKPNVHRFCPALPQQLITETDSVQVCLDTGETLTAKLVIGADGSNSWTRKQAGMQVREFDYQQKAVVTTVKTTQHHQETAWQCFMPDGTLAFLPLTDGYSSIVWSTGVDHADELLKLNDADFKNALQTAFNNTLGDVTDISDRAAFPLRSRHASQYVTSRIALIGDAAHTIHPLAGQGVNLGLADAATLAEVLTEALQQNRDIGRTSVLRRYERWRKGSNTAMLGTMTGFKLLFGNEQPVIRGVRNLGLNMTEAFPPAKNFFIRYAMGLAGDLPRLARQSPASHD